MEVICLHDEAFYELVEQVVDRIKEKHKLPQEKWVSQERAMQLLNIKSRTTIQKLRDTGAISYSQPQKKIILYDYDSIMAYLESHRKSTF
ncbi:helix-turn-helix domain-containing protein [uncultured Kordia sp.]|uniref:helix-turn-helix domain-containing protein n=1 Tax=uncultured Kordia sp. TaxID=507699 RepID=UPI0026290616|nr:helix-turn-helix domain-containing protein [uncultured Kordia sp.]